MGDRTSLVLTKKNRSIKRNFLYRGLGLGQIRRAPPGRMSTENGMSPSLRMLKSFPYKTQSVGATASLTIMSNDGEKENQSAPPGNPTIRTDTFDASHQASESEERREDSDDEFHNILPIDMAFHTSSSNSGFLPEQGVNTRRHYRPFDFPLNDPLPDSRRGGYPDFPFSPYMIPASDAYVQVGGTASTSMGELVAVEESIQGYSRNQDVDSEIANQFPTHMVDRNTSTTLRSVPPPPPDYLFAENWWGYEIAHPGQHLSSEFHFEPSTAVASRDLSGITDEPEDSTFDDRKPSASSFRFMKKGGGTGRTDKEAHKKKMKPRKIRSRAKRNSNGSSSSSSPSAGSPATKQSDVGTHEGIGPDTEELQEATTERARLALKSWHNRLNDLIRFRSEHHHTNVPQKYPENTELGVWVNKQRMEKKAFDEGKKSSMTDKKIAKLERAGFKWAKPKGVGSWEKRYKELQEYINDRGDPHVPTKFKENRALGRWVSTQRNMYKKYRETGAFNNLDTNEILRRIRLLDRLGFSWTMSASSGSDSAGGNDSGGHYRRDGNNQPDDAPSDEV